MGEWFGDWFRAFGATTASRSSSRATWAGVSSSCPSLRWHRPHQRCRGARRTRLPLPGRGRPDHAGPALSHGRSGPRGGLATGVVGRPNRLDCRGPPAVHRPLKIGVPKETAEGERRVALVPDVVEALTAKEIEVAVEAGAGEGASHPDSEYTDAGATRRRRPLERRRRPQGHAADRRGGRPPEAGPGPDRLPRAAHQSRHWRSRWPSAGVTSFAMEAIPRITRAQSMDALSSQANLGGYIAVLIAARESGKLFPMMTTAAGTIPPAKVLVLGAGVAGLQAIATAQAPRRRRHRLRRPLGGQGAGPVARRPLPRGRGRQGRRGRGRLRAPAHRRGEREASAGARRGRQAPGRDHHDCPDPGPAGAAADHRRGRQEHGAGLGDHRPGRRDRRQRRGLQAR